MPCEMRFVQFIVYAIAHRAFTLAHGLAPLGLWRIISARQ